MSDIDFLKAVAERVHGISLANAIGLLEDAQRFVSEQAAQTRTLGTGFDLYTQEGLTAYARTLPKVTEQLAQGKFIQAIKEYRTHLSTLTSDYAVSGLKSVKEALDPIKYAYTPWDQQQY